MLLPLPLRPTMPKNSPAATSKLTSRTASRTSIAAGPERMQGPLLERVVLLVGKPEGLAHGVDRNRRLADGGSPRARLASRCLAEDRAHGRDGSNRTAEELVLLSRPWRSARSSPRTTWRTRACWRKSLAEHNPGTRLWTLIIDDFSRYIDPAEEPFEVLTPTDIDCGRSRTWRCVTRCWSSQPRSSHGCCAPDGADGGPGHLSRSRHQGLRSLNALDERPRSTASR